MAFLTNTELKCEDFFKRFNVGKTESEHAYLTLYSDEKYMFEIVDSVTGKEKEIFKSDDNGYYDVVPNKNNKDQGIIIFWYDDHVELQTRYFYATNKDGHKELSMFIAKD